MKVGQDAAGRNIRGEIEEDKAINMVDVAILQPALKALDPKGVLATRSVLRFDPEQIARRDRVMLHWLYTYLQHGLRVSLLWVAMGCESHS